MKMCLDCGYELPDEASFCMYCGCKLLENKNKKCPHCGFKDLPQEAVFCPNCGKKLPLQNIEKQPTAQLLSCIVGGLLQHKHKEACQHSIQEKKEASFPKLVTKVRGGLHVGDYFYSDGTTSTQLLPQKKAVGVVFSLETTEEEKKHGWTHGHIFALSGIKINVRRKYPFLGEHLELTKTLHWTRGSNNAKQIFPNSEKRSLVEAIGDKDGFIYTNNPETNGLNYEVFNAARAYNTICPLPQNKTSKWYLPAIGQLYELLINLGGIPASSLQTTKRGIINHPRLVLKSQRKGFINLMQKYGYDGNNALGQVHHIASSSEYGKDWCWNLDMEYDGSEDMYIETIAKHNGPSLEVYAVAAF